MARNGHKTGPTKAEGGGRLLFLLSPGAGDLTIGGGVRRVIVATERWRSRVSSPDHVI